MHLAKMRRLVRDGDLGRGRAWARPCAVRSHSEPIMIPGLPANCAGVTAEQGEGFKRPVAGTLDKTDKRLLTESSAGQVANLNLLQPLGGKEAHVTHHYQNETSPTRHHVQRCHHSFFA